jgi:hypothetical protein
MKVVKLNRRFAMYKDHGHEVALRFSAYTDKVRAVERTAQSLFGSQYAHWDKYPHWRSYFGKASGHTPNRPFWITFRNPAHLTMLMLKLESNPNG